jgi:hypothetical protein
MLWIHRHRSRRLKHKLHEEWYWTGVNLLSDRQPNSRTRPGRRRYHRFSGSGAAYHQASPPFSFNGKYGLFFTQGTSGGEIDATAQVGADAGNGTLSGVVDTNLPLSPQPNTSLSGTFGAVSSSGRSAGALTNTFFPSLGATPNTLAIDYYLIDSGHGYFIETDSLSQGVLTLGYFAARTPMCPTCP